MHGIVIALLLALPPLTMDQAADLAAQADRAVAGKDNATAAGLYVQAIEAGAARDRYGYKAACCFALAGKVDEAFRWLDAAVEAGFAHVDHLKADPDLASLHADPRWKQSVARAEARQAAAIEKLTHKELRLELLRRMRIDQDIRRQKNPDISKWMKIDADNTAYMKKVIAEHGLPGYAMVGKDGALAVFLLIQHADKDRPFQNECLALMRAKVADQQFSGTHLAYLTDRVLVGQGKPQIYGTQLVQINGVLEPSPIEDRDNVDQRRKEVGLGPLADYIEMVRRNSP